MSLAIVAFHAPKQRPAADDAQPSAQDFRRGGDVREDSESASPTSSVVTPDSAPQLVRSRRAKMWPLQRADKAQRTAERNVAKDAVLAKMNHLLGMLARPSSAPADFQTLVAACTSIDEIQKLANGVWHHDAVRGAAKLADYFTRILSNLNDSQRKQIAVATRMLGRSPTKLALEAALRSVERPSTAARRAASAGVALVDRFRSLRSRLTLMRESAPARREAATRREMDRQIRGVFSAVRAGQPGRAASLLNKSVPVVRAMLGGPVHPSTLNAAFYEQLTKALQGLTLGQVEAIAACSPTVQSDRPEWTNGSEPRSNILARCIADALFAKRVCDPKSSCSAEQLATLGVAASKQALLALPEPAVAQEPGLVSRSALLDRAASLRRTYLKEVETGLCAGLNRLAEGELADMLRDFHHAAGARSSAGAISKTLESDLICKPVQEHLASLAPEARKALRQWFESDQFNDLMFRLESAPLAPRAASNDVHSDPRWQTVRQLLSITKEQVMSMDAGSGEDSKSGAGRPTGDAGKLDLPIDAVPRALACLGFDRSVLAAAEKQLEEVAMVQIEDMDKRQGDARASDFNITWQTLRDMQSGSDFRVKVGIAPEVRVRASNDRSNLLIHRPGVDEPQALVTTDNLGSVLGAEPELLKKALYFATQEVVAIFEAPMPRDEALTRAVGRPFNFNSGAVGLRYTIAIQGSIATVDIDYTRAKIPYLADRVTRDIIEMDAARSYLRLSTRLEVSLDQPTRLVPGGTTLNFSLVAMPDDEA